MNVTKLSRLGFLAAVAATAGCSVSAEPSEVNVKPEGLKPAATGAAIATNPPVAFPNSQKYADRGSHPATGRAGSATLTARALMDKNNVTDLEATTGALDTSVTPPGNIDKMQLKILDGSGDALYTKNYNGLTGGGYAHYQYTSFAHGEQLQVQTNISGIDPRTDVVTMPVSVKYRPDLSPVNLVAPAKAYVHSSVTIGATVRELKMDTGANADCVLSIDGAQVDQARGIWVDAGGAVSCAFTSRFDVVGVHAIQVAVNNVVPGDYDTSNNAVAGSIEIINPNIVNYQAYAYDESFSYDNTQDLYYSSTTTPDRHDHWTGKGWQQGWYVSSWSPTGPTWPLKSVSYSGSTNGSAFGSVSLANQNYSYSSTWSDGTRSGSYGYLWAYDSTSSTWLQVNGGNWTDGTNTYGWSGSWAQHWAGDVTYHSDGYCNNTGWWWGWGCGYGNYTWNNDYTQVAGGARLAMGSTVNLSLSVTDANNSTWSANPVVSMTPFSYSYDTGRACYNPYWWWYYGGASQICYQYVQSNVGSQGWTYGSNTN